MGSGRIKAADFDPFSLSYLSNRFRRTRIVIGVVMLALLPVVNAVQGTLGGAEDLRRIGGDVLIVFGRREDPGQIEFPLARDLASWILLGAIVLGTILLRRQWQYMSKCLSRLVDNGALVAKRVQTRHGPGGTTEFDASRTFGLSRVSKAMRVDRMIEGCTAENALAELVRRVNTCAANWSPHVFLLRGVLAVVLGVLFTRGLEGNLFVTLAPDFQGAGEPRRERTRWLESAYSGWWAGDDHPLGHLLYLCFAVYAFYIILSFSAVGFVAIYLGAALRYVCRPGADWLNCDGRYGWRALAEVYLTVLSAVAILGVALTVALAVIDIRNRGLFAVVVLYVVIFIPAFVLIPHILFRRAADLAKQERIHALARAVRADEIGAPSRLSHVASVAAEIERCRSADIRPLRPWPASNPTLFGLIILPILLAALQTFFPWLAGS